MTGPCASLQITRLGALDNLPRAQRHTWPLSVQVSGVNMPSEVFIYQAGQTVEQPDRFKCIATVNDFYELPKEQGVSITRTTQIPFYRRAQMDLVLRSAAEAESVWAIVQEELQTLVTNYNSSQNLFGIQSLTVTSNLISDTTLMNTPPFNYRLAYAPAGTATITNYGVQGITSPDNTIRGWLPASSAPSPWSIPAGAFLFYNIAQDPGLLALWPPAQPYGGSQLYRNGLLMPYGVTHVFTGDTIWWLNFDPTTLPNYAHVMAQNQDGNAPWPTSYINPSNPGDVAPLLTVSIFK